MFLAIYNSSEKLLLALLITEISKFFQKSLLICFCHIISGEKKLVTMAQILHKIGVGLSYFQVRSTPPSLFFFGEIESAIKSSYDTVKQENEMKSLSYAAKALFAGLTLFIVLLSANQVGAQNPPPTIISQTPDNNATNVLINTVITIQFDMTMDTGSGWFSLRDEGFDQEVAGTVQWQTTTLTNDTLVFIPQNALKPGNVYSYEGNPGSESGSIYFEAAFITKPSSSDTTPPTIRMVYPRPSMTGVSTTQRIHIRPSELMTPATINGTNITISGLTPGDYEVMNDEGWVEIAKDTPFSASTAYTVTITTNVKDLRGNPLKDQFQWTFTTGAVDSTHPTVAQTIPADGALKVSPSTSIHVIFSKEMDLTTINSDNITIVDDAQPPNPVDIEFMDMWNDRIRMAPAGFGPFAAGHAYTVTIGTGVKDRVGNSLSQPYSWDFTVPSTGDTAPTLFWGIDSDSQLGQRWSDGSTGVWLELGAGDQETDELAVTATDLTQSPKTWTLTRSSQDLYQYSYMSTGNENRNAGNHTLKFNIKDGALNTISFERKIFIFGSSPVLNSPASAATGVSTTPTFQWTYGDTPRPLYYSIAVLDGPDLETGRVIWKDYVGDLGSGTHSITIPADKKLAANTTYFWVVAGTNEAGNGETWSAIRSFTTGGTPPPSPSFANVQVRSDNRTGGMRWNLSAKVLGPDPADITELKVTGPGGFQYIFTEDDINQNEQNGLSYAHDILSVLSDGTYTFTVTDSQGRTVSANVDFTGITVPIVSAGTMVPADSAYVDSTTPTFYWESLGGGYYYRIQIFDWNNLERNVYTSNYSLDAQATVPAGILLADTPYKWRAEAYDPTYQNRSASDTLRFSTGASPYTLGLSSGMIWSDNNYYGGQRKSLNATVTGPLPNDVHTPPGSFTVTGPGGFSHTFTGPEVTHGLTPGTPYGYGDPGFPQNGDYTFTVQDRYGNTGTPIIKNVTTTQIPIVDQATMSPENNAYLFGTTPTLSWGAVSGSNRYYRVTINDWNLRYPVYQSPRVLGGTSVDIPPGILGSDRSYKWRVEVFDASTGADADNRSSGAFLSFTTMTADTAPNPFAFVDQADVALSTVITSNTITVTGINTAAPISITGTGATYSINGGAYTNAGGTVNDGDTITVRLLSSSSFSTTTDATLTIGGVSDTFSVTTLAADTIPDPFTFTDQTDVPVNTVIMSNEITVSGINTAASISITGGEYSINGGAYTDLPGTVNNDDRVTVRQTSSSDHSTTTTATLTLGGVTDSFSVTTLAADTTPDPFTFTDRTNVPLNTVITSNSIQVVGINTAAPISITPGGEYSINGGDFTPDPGMVNYGDTVTVRLTSSSNYSTTTTATLTLGGVSDTLSVMTAAEPESVTEIIVVSPNGGETLVPGSTPNIQWNAPASASKFTLQYSVDNKVTWQTIDSNISETSYPWTVPPQTGNKKKCFVKVTGFDLNNVKVGTDASDRPFGIEVMKLVSPDGGVLGAGLPYTIRWETSTSAVKFMLQYSDDNKVTWKPVVPGTVPGSSYSWVVPRLAANKNKCFIKVTGLDINNRTVGTDISDGPFTIEVVRVERPNGAETLPSANTYSVTWKTNGTIRDVASVKVMYTMDGGLTWKPAGQAAAGNPGFFYWTPLVAKTKLKCKVKVTLYDLNRKAVGSDMSDSFFTINGP
jgi:hypothetical protein